MNLISFITICFLVMGICSLITFVILLDELKVIKQKLDTLNNQTKNKNAND